MMSGSTNPAKGFTLVEILVALAIFGLIFMTFLNIFDMTNQMSKAQHSVSNITEGTRYAVAEITRMTRMVGTGAMPIAAWDDAQLAANAKITNISIDVIDNIVSGQSIGKGINAREVIPGTDVLTIRGVIAGMLFEIDGPSDQSNPFDISGAPATYVVTIPAEAPYSGRNQYGDDKIDGEPPNKKVLPFVFGEMLPTKLPVSPGLIRDYSRYHVAILTDVVYGAQAIPGDDTSRPLIITVKTTASNEEEEDIIALNNRGVCDMIADNTPFVITGGVVETIQYFVSVNEAGIPALYRYFQGDDEANELVPNISDLQIALGCDLDNNGELNENGLVADDDEWIFNVDGEAFSNNTDGALALMSLRQLRLSVIGRGDAYEMDWDQLDSDAVRGFEIPENGNSISPQYRNYRHAVTTVTLKPRSHPPVEAGLPTPIHDLPVGP